MKSQDEFDAKYSGNPEFNWDDQEGQEGMMENFGEYYAKVAEQNEKNPKTVWTIEEVENGDMIIYPGMNHYDSFMYFISNEEWENEDEKYIWFSSDMMDNGEDESEAKVEAEDLELHWELGIDKGEDEGTETLESFDTLKEAIKALKECEDESAFIDLWKGSKEMGQYIRKSEL